MFHFYLIDPAMRSVEKVTDGFDRAPELTHCSTPELDTLWIDPSNPDASVDIAYSPDTEEDAAFRLRLAHDGQTIERVVSGKAVLMACGPAPEDIERQLATAEAVNAVIEFCGRRTTDVAAWLKSRLRQKTPTDNRHAPIGQWRKRGNGASGPR
ncbi:hypothetical protein QF002_001171 [Paraburkholderia youngii]